MLINYEFSNFNSFRETTSFSMIPSPTKVKKRFQDSYVELSSGYTAQKTAVIVGENAGGKSNFVQSLDYFKFLFSNNNRIKSIKSLVNFNNLTKNCAKDSNTTQTFDLEISGKNDTIFHYLLKIDVFSIIYEALLIQEDKRKKPILIFEAKRGSLNVECESDTCQKQNCCVSKVQGTYDITANEKYFGATEMDLLNKNSYGNNVGLFVTKLALLGCEPAITFTTLIQENLCPDANIGSYSAYKAANQEQEDLDILRDKRFIDIFRLVDYSIVNIEIDEDAPFKKSIVYRKRKNGELFSRELAKDSSGVREFFAWAVQIYKVIYQNKIVIADEMDRVLNPVLTDRVLALIHGTEHKGQFIFTTHNALHLDLTKFMKEQIYFVTKDSETLESEMYSLADFPDIRYENTKVYEFYLKGILGGTASEG